MSVDLPLDVLNMVLLLSLAFIFGMNNTGVVIGPLLVSRLNYRSAQAVTALGFIMGLLLEGYKLSYPIILNEVEVTRSIILGVTSITLLLSSILGIPASMVNILFINYIAIEGSDTVYLIIIAWVVLPAVAFFTSMLIYRVIVRITSRLSLIGVIRFYVVALYIASFYTAYSIGSNNLGLLYSIGYGTDLYTNYAMILLLATFILGLFNGSRVSVYISEGIVGLTPARILASVFNSSVILWISTQMHIPLSFIHILISSMLGSGMSVRPSIYNRRGVIILLIAWIILTILSFLVTMLLSLMV